MGIIKLTEKESVDSVLAKAKIVIVQPVENADGENVDSVRLAPINRLTTRVILQGNCEVSDNKVSDAINITDEKQNYPSIKYLKEYYYDMEAVDELLDDKANTADMDSALNLKYDASNVETGTSELTYTAENISGVSLSYQKSGNFVTIQFSFSTSAAISEATDIVFNGLPYKNNNQVSGICVSTSTKSICPAIVSSFGSKLTVTLPAGVKSGEKIATAITYKIY